MRVRAMFVLAIAAAALVALATTALAGSPTDRATGGGQVLFGTQGAGNTIAFTAQGSGSNATGQFQLIDRQGGVKKHGIINCLNVSGSTAEIFGYNRDDPTDTFELFVQDNGEGAAASNDIVAFNDSPQGSCSNPNDNDRGDTELARGNVQVYDAP